MRELIDRAESGDALEKIAAFGGPLENFVALHGEGFISRLEAEAAENDALREALGYLRVLFNRVGPRLWERVQRAAGLDPEPYPADRLASLERELPGVEQLATGDFFPPGVLRPEIEPLREDEVDTLVSSWFRYQERFWAFEAVGDAVTGDEPEAAWRLLLALIESPLADAVLGIVAAGPLEDFLSCRGADFIERVEAKAASDPRFRECLGGVWQARMSDELWARVVRAMDLPPPAEPPTEP